MPRLAGLYGESGDGGIPVRLERMLEVAAGPSVQRRIVTIPGAGLAWQGRGEPAMAQMGGRTVALDGRLLRQPDPEEPSDARFFARLCEQYGFPEAMARIRGDVAVALYDADERALWLGRDPFGVKPLYYRRYSGGVAFASRLASLLVLPGEECPPDPRYVALYAGAHYRYFDNDPDASPCAGVHQVPAAHALRLSPAGVAARSRYWALAERPLRTEDEPTLARRYQELLSNAVSRRLAAAERPVFTLSGGLDSSSVLASAVSLTASKQQALSAVYTDKTYDESEEIRPMLQMTVERWHALTIAPTDVFPLIERMIREHDEPVATATWLSHFLLCEYAAREGFASLFGGLGGDELNAGEYEYFPFHFADLRTAGHDDELAHEVASWIQHHDHPTYRKSPAVVQDALATVIDPSTPGRCRSDRRRLERYAAALHRDFFDLKTFEPVMEAPFSSYLSTRTYQDLTRETLPCCLRASDRNEETFGLTGFLPFLDRDVVEFMFTVPGRFKIRDGITKRLLREAMRGILPEETRVRVKKMGWNAPAHRWFSGAAADALRDLVRSQEFRERGIYDVPVVLSIVDEHERIVASGEPRENHMMFLWQLANLDIWLRLLKEKRSGTGRT